MRRGLILLVASLMFSSLGMAVVWEFPLDSVKSLAVRSKAARVILEKGMGSLLRISVTGAQESNWKAEVREDQIVVRGPENQGQTEDSVLSVQLPATTLPSTFVFEDVKAEIQGGSRITLNSLRGKITSRRSGEGMRFFLQKGELQVVQQSGSVDIESYGARVSVLEGQGATKIKLFSGDLLMEKNSGPLSLDCYSSSAKVNGHRGSFALNWGKGNLSVSDFSGRLEGRSQEGLLQLQVKSDAMIDLEAERGRIVVQVPGDSGSQLNLRTAQGELSVPGPLKPARQGRYKVARGQLVGSGRGSINVRAEEASLIVK